LGTLGGMRCQISGTGMLHRLPSGGKTNRGADRCSKVGRRDPLKTQGFCFYLSNLLSNLDERLDAENRCAAMS